MIELKLWKSLLILLILTSCSNDQADIRGTEMDAPVLTGFNFRDDDGNPLNTLGIPNVRTVLNTNDIKTSCKIVVYPNPARDNVSVALYFPNKNATAYIWLVKGTVTDELLNYSVDGNMLNLVVQGNPVVQYSFEITEVNSNSGEGGIKPPGGSERSNSVALNLSTVPEGYYRIYVRIGDALLYDNIIVNK